MAEKTEVECPLRYLTLPWMLHLLFLLCLPLPLPLSMLSLQPLAPPMPMPLPLHLFANASILCSDMCLKESARAKNHELCA